MWQTSIRIKQEFSFLFRDGTITDLGLDAEIENRYAKSSFERILDATGKSILPGLVDGHTHPVWAGDRVHEFAMKVKPYKNPYDVIDWIRQ